MKHAGYTIIRIHSYCWRFHQRSLTATIQAMQLYIALQSSTSDGECGFYHIFGNESENEAITDSK